jgi:very-short-patch-repair endonuclease
MRFELPLQYSDLEIKFFLILKELGIRFLTQEIIAIRKDDKIKYYSVDFLIPKSFYYHKIKHPIVFEIQSSLHKQRGRMKKDEIKKEDLEREGYRVVEIWEDELDNQEELRKKIMDILKEEGYEIRK